MKKVYLGVSLVILIAILSVSLASASSSSSQNITEWRMAGRDLNASHHYPGSAHGNISQVVQTNSSVSLSLSGSPIVIADGFLYLGDGSKFYKLNASNVAETIDQSPSISTLYITSPTVWDKWVYTSRGSTYYQFNSSNLSSYITYGVGSGAWTSVAIYNNFAYFASPSTDLIYRANASNISQIIESVSKTNCESSMAIANDNLYIACSSTLYHLNASNISQQYGSVSLGAGVDNRGGVTLGGDYVYVNAGNDVLQYNASDITQEIGSYTAGGQVDAGLVYAHNSIYAGSWDDKLYRLNATNVSNLIDSVTLTGNIYYRFGVTDEHIFVNSNGVMYQIDAFNLSNTITSISIGGNHNALAIANGNVYTAMGARVRQWGDGSPSATTVSPVNAYEITQATENLTFNCSAVSSIGLKNISLYITNSSNENFGFNDSTDITGNSNSSSWELELENGNYTWGCQVYDIEDNFDWSSNRSIFSGISAPVVGIESPANGTSTINSSLEIYYNVTSDLLDSCWYTNDTMSVNYSLSGCINITGVSWPTGPHNVTVYANDTLGNVGSDTVMFTILADVDMDGIADISDPLLYSESNVSTSGVNDLNITVGGNATNGSFSGVQEVLFYDGSSLLMNFSHNFSESTLDLSNISITVTSTSIVVNLSGQLQSSFNKTLYLPDNGLTSLCVKDQEIASVGEISSGCTGANETDFTSCLGGSATLNGIICVDEGSTIRVSNLQYSGIMGSAPSALSSIISSITSIFGGGSGGGWFTQCADGKDNDGDGFIDYPEDLGCSSLNDRDEYDPEEEYDTVYEEKNKKQLNLEERRTEKIAEKTEDVNEEISNEEEEKEESHFGKILLLVIGLIILVSTYYIESVRLKNLIFPDNRWYVSYKYTIIISVIILLILIF